MADKSKAYIKGFAEECFQQGMPEQHAYMLLKVAGIIEDGIEKQAAPVPATGVGKLLKWMSSGTKTGVGGGLRKYTEGMFINPWKRVADDSLSKWDTVLPAVLKSGIGVGAPAAGLWYGAKKKLEDWENTMTKGTGIWGDKQGLVDDVITWWKGDPLEKMKTGPDNLPEGLNRRYSSPTSASEAIPLNAGWSGNAHTAPQATPGSTAMGYGYDNRAAEISKLDEAIARGEALTDPQQRNRWELEQKPHLIAQRDNLKKIQNQSRIPGGGTVQSEIDRRTKLVKELEKRVEFRNKRLDKLRAAETDPSEMFNLEQAGIAESDYLYNLRRDLDQLYRLRASGKQ